MLYLTGSSLDINSITFFVLQSPIVADVREPGFNVGSFVTTLITNLRATIYHWHIFNLIIFHRKYHFSKQYGMLIQVSF